MKQIWFIGFEIHPLKFIFDQGNRTRYVLIRLQFHEQATILAEIVDVAKYHPGSWLLQCTASISLQTFYDHKIVGIADCQKAWSQSHATRFEVTWYNTINNLSALFFWNSAGPESVETFACIFEELKVLDALDVGFITLLEQTKCHWLNLSLFSLEGHVFLEVLRVKSHKLQSGAQEWEQVCLRYTCCMLQFLVSINIGTVQSILVTRNSGNPRLNTAFSWNLEDTVSSA